MSRSCRTILRFPDFSLRRLLLQSAGVRGSPTIAQRHCDVEKGISKQDKNSGAGSSNSHNSTAKNNANDTSSSHSETPPPRSDSTRRNLLESSDSIIECPLCYNRYPAREFFILTNCEHDFCLSCLERYLYIEITESRVDIACPQCPIQMHPENIRHILRNHDDIIEKYEDFMVRRVLLTDPDSRWCPAPDCGYAVIATGCASCPRIKCERPGCNLNFCYHCKAEWHPDLTCDAARALRQSPIRVPSGSLNQSSLNQGEIKPCPNCQVLIYKMDDGSCNHMICTLCGTGFCWLCMKEIGDLHYLSPSGCTFWGKKPWSRKKKLLWQLGTLIGAPVGIALVAGIAVPAMMIGIPVWVGRKIHTKFLTNNKHKRNCALLGGVVLSILVSPILAGLAVAIGVPILLFYVYGVVPVSLCRAGCGVSTTRDGFKFDFDEEVGMNSRNPDAASVDAVSRIGATSIGEVSLSVASGSNLGVSTQTPSFGIAHINNRESTTALAGSITGHRLEVQADVSTSETASAVTCVSEKSGNTLNDTASTKALAGSISSYCKNNTDSANVSEDGASERVRFDRIICYIDNRKELQDNWYSPSGDHDVNADKASVSSGRSFRSSERSFREELDNASVSSGAAKRATTSQRTKLNSNLNRNHSMDSTSYNIPENATLKEEVGGTETDTSSEKDLTPKHTEFNVNRNDEVIKKSILEINLKEEKSELMSKSDLNDKTLSLNKNRSKTAILRNLFFSQNDNSGNNSNS